MKESKYDLVKQGSTSYAVVYPADTIPGSYVDIAADELCDLISESTGVFLSCIPDTGLTHKTDNKYISLGNTSLLASSGLDTDTSGLGGDGYKIITKDQSVFLYAKTTHGVLYAVYEFLYYQFGFEFLPKTVTVWRKAFPIKIAEFRLYRYSFHCAAIYGRRNAELQ